MIFILVILLIFSVWISTVNRTHMAAIYLCKNRKKAMKYGT